ncbi:MAG TPA: hypothetical protein VGY97_01145 [Solirubrobacteraceae bacterium]|nr:hypothetical protein [Solirubrobacteraceae bacterium]
MQEAFGIVLFVVVLVGAVVAVLSLLGRRRLYDQIGRGMLSLDRDEAPRPPAPGSSGSALERDEEIRQLLAARNERRARRGEAPLDLETEMARLTAPAVDPALAAEVRQLVIARNERRARAGQPPLDVDAEVARQLRELGA